MRNILILFLCCALASAQAQNPLSVCGIPESCHQGIIDFANDYLPVFPKDCRLWDGACGYDNEISRPGKVIIGSGNFSLSNYNLGVWGGILTEQLKICQTEWCDYVFEDTFNLMPLGQVQDWVAQKRYLPGCTPEATIQSEGGYHIETVTAQQQAKIEELFLHLIALDQRINALLPNFRPTTVASPETAPLTLLESGSTKTILHPQTDSVRSVSPSMEKTLAPTAYNCANLEDIDCQVALYDLLAPYVEGPVCDQWDGNCASLGSPVYYHRAGNVCIGTTLSQSGYSLAVKGGIVTDFCKIQLCESDDWCDYVFDPNYSLLPLGEVAQYIRAHKHLPGMIDQNTIEEQAGYTLKEVKMQQQVKIEEAYLHVLELERKKKELERRIANHSSTF